MNVMSDDMQTLSRRFATGRNEYLYTSNLRSMCIQAHALCQQRHAASSLMTIPLAVTSTSKPWCTSPTTIVQQLCLALLQHVVVAAFNQGALSTSPHQALVSISCTPTSLRESLPP